MLWTALHRWLGSLDVASISSLRPSCWYRLLESDASLKRILLNSTMSEARAWTLRRVLSWSRSLQTTLLAPKIDGRMTLLQIMDSSHQKTSPSFAISRKRPPLNSSGTDGLRPLTAMDVGNHISSLESATSINSRSKWKNVVLPKRPFQPWRRNTTSSKRILKFTFVTIYIRSRPQWWHIWNQFQTNPIAPLLSNL